MEPTNALNETKSVRRLIGVMWTFYLIGVVAYGSLGERNIVSMGCLGVVGIFLIVNAVLLVRWRLRYSTSDETKQARHSWNLSLIFWIVMALLGLVPALLFVFFPVKSATH